MNNQHSHGISSRLKRKEREPFYPAKRSPLAPPAPPPPATVTASTTVTTSKGSKAEEVLSSNQLLAGYMAYEFLSKGTVLGQRLDRAGGKSKCSESEMESPAKTLKAKESYKEITSLLMMKNEGGSGIRIPGIVNPTQLARWIQM